MRSAIIILFAASIVHLGAAAAISSAPVKWCTVVGDYIVVDDYLFNYISAFTRDGGRRHFLFTVAMVESRLNPYSKRGSSGEIGMMQVMPATGNFIARLSGSKTDLRQVRDNVAAALRYLNYILATIERHCGADLPLKQHVMLAAAAYNGGTARIKDSCSTAAFNPAARRYARNFWRWWQKKYVARSYYEKYLDR